MDHSERYPTLVRTISMTLTRTSWKRLPGEHWTRDYSSRLDGATLLRGSDVDERKKRTGDIKKPSSGHELKDDPEEQSVEEDYDNDSNDGRPG